MKKSKGIKNAHTSNSKHGMGDYYGTGIKNKVGRMREEMMTNSMPSSKKTKTPPRSLA